MRTASPRRALTATWPQRAAPAALPRAVRTVDRWGLLAGVTGFLGNVLLVILFTTPADGPYAWTGPANDIAGVVSALAMIPVAAGLLTVCGNRPGLGMITSLAIVAMVVIAAVSMLFVLGRVPYTADADTFYVGLTFISGWLLAANRAGRASARLPRQVAHCGVALGAAGLAAAALAAASVPMPAYSLIHDITRGAALLAGGLAALAFPVWLIVLSCRLPGHLADRLGSPDETIGGALNALSRHGHLVRPVRRVLRRRRPRPADPADLGRFGHDVMATASAHRAAWFASTWLITLSIAAGLAAVELLVRTLDADLARVGRSLYLAGSTLGLASTTYDLSVTSTLLGAPRLPDWYLGARHWADGLGTAYFALLAPAAMGCIAVAILRTHALPTWTGYVFLIATVLLLGQYAAFRGALPFPQFLAFIAVGVAALIHRAPATPSPDREPAELAARD